MFFDEPKRSNYSWNSPFWIDWRKWRRECMYNRINNRIYYNHGKAHTIVINPFKQITTFLEISDSGSPYVILFSCLVVQFFSKVTLYVTYFSRYFSFFTVYIIFIEIYIYIYIYIYIPFIFHLSVFKYNLIKIWRFEHFVQGLFNACFYYCFL